MWSWDKSGKVYISKWNGTTYVKQAAPALDISEEVGDWGDFGLLSICPDRVLKRMALCIFIMLSIVIIYCMPEHPSTTQIRICTLWLQSAG